MKYVPSFFVHDDHTVAKHTPGGIQAEVAGTCLFIWHDDKPRYDEVCWEPCQISPREADRLAEYRLRVDRRATRVQVDYGGRDFAEAIRPSSTDVKSMTA